MDKDYNIDNKSFFEKQELKIIINKKTNNLVFLPVWRLSKRLYNLNIPQKLKL